MASNSLRRSHKILGLLIDWLIVIWIIYSGLLIIGLPGAGSIILIVLILAVLILISLAYFKLLRLAFGKTPGVFIVLGLRRLYKRIKSDSGETANELETTQDVTLCPRCEKEIELTDKFCSECGKDLT